MFKLAPLTLLLAAALSTAGETSAIQATPARPGQIAVQALGGIAAGTLLGLVGYGLGMGARDGLDGFALGAYLGVGGYAVGNALGIILVGRAQGLDGSPLLTIAGSAVGQGLGILLGMGLYEMMDNNGGDADGVAAATVMFSLPVALGLAAYDGSHAWGLRHPGASPAALGPGPVMQPGSAGNSRSYRVELARFRF